MPGQGLLELDLCSPNWRSAVFGSFWGSAGGTQVGWAAPVWCGRFHLARAARVARQRLATELATRAIGLHDPTARDGERLGSHRRRDTPRLVPVAIPPSRLPPLVAARAQGLGQFPPRARARWPPGSGGASASRGSGADGPPRPRPWYLPTWRNAPTAFLAVLSCQLGRLRHPFISTGLGAHPAPEVQRLSVGMAKSWRSRNDSGPYRSWRSSVVQAQIR